MRRKLGFHDQKYMRLSRRFKCNTRVKFRKRLQMSVSEAECHSFMSEGGTRHKNGWKYPWEYPDRRLSLALYTLRSICIRSRKGPWMKGGGDGPVSVQSWAPGIGQVENDGRVHRLEVHRARRGVNKRGGSVCHHTVT